MIERHIFDVEYDDNPPREFRVRVTMADKADTELVGIQYGVMDPARQPHTVGLLWLWHAARREGHVDPSTTFDEFRTRCLDNAKVSDEPVDPTRSGTIDGSLSTSPDGSQASPTPGG